MRLHSRAGAAVAALVIFLCREIHFNDKMRSSCRKLFYLSVILFDFLKYPAADLLVLHMYSSAIKKKIVCPGWKIDRTDDEK